MDAKIYQGTPKEIIMRMSDEIAEVLHKAGIPPSGLHVMAMLHVAACSICTGRDEPSESLGIMPSFKTVLSILTHTIADSEWSDEELEAFQNEFMVITKSLGGQKVPRSEAQPWISQSSGGMN